jgi:hypothetical protein
MARTLRPSGVLAYPCSEDFSRTTRAFYLSVRLVQDFQNVLSLDFV